MSIAIAAIAVLYLAIIVLGARTFWVCATPEFRDYPWVVPVVTFVGAAIPLGYMAWHLFVGGE